MRKPALGRVSAIWAFALAAAVWPGIAIGDDVAAQVADLRNAVRRLEKENEDLRSRLVKVEAQLAGKGRNSEANRSETATGSKQSTWRKLRIGMEADEVTALLGDPERVVVGSALTFWYYKSADAGSRLPSVRFNKTGMTVDGWDE
jgi:hypothetical protein